MDGAVLEQEKKREAAQGLGPGGVHVLKEEEEKNGIFAGDGTNGFLTCRIFFHPDAGGCCRDVFGGFHKLSSL